MYLADNLNEAELAQLLHAAARRNNMNLTQMAKLLAHTAQHEGCPKSWDIAAAFLRIAHQDKLAHRRMKRRNEAATAH